MEKVIACKVCCGKTILMLNDDINKLYAIYNDRERVSVEPYGEVKFMVDERLYVQTFRVVKR